VVGADVDGRAEGVLVGEAVVGDRVDGFCVGDSVGLSVVGWDDGDLVGIGVDGDVASSIIWLLSVAIVVVGPEDSAVVVGREFGASVVGLLFSGLAVGKLVGTSKFGGSVAIGMGAPDGAGVGSLLDGPGDGARLSISAGEKVGKGD
jgi:hypothetical protein